MPHDLIWTDVALRLLLTAIAAALIGLNRGHHGRAAGLRTTMLVCMAASLSMIEANALLNTHGKTAGEYASMDVLRLPLGILSGIGFIGAGAIVRKGSLVSGLTTAATLWFVTVMGLCFGGRQFGLGISAFGVAILILWGLKAVESYTKREQRATLTVQVQATGPDDVTLRSTFRQAGYKVTAYGFVYGADTGSQTLTYQLQWSAYHWQTRVPVFVTDLARQPGISHLEWKPQLIEVGSEMGAD